MSDKKGNLFYSGYSGVVAADVGISLTKTIPTTETTYVTNLIAALELHLARKCNRNFLTSDKTVTPAVDQVYTDIFDGGKENYYTRNFPIKTVTKITLSNVVIYDITAPNSNEMALDDDFFVYEDHINFDVSVYSNTDDNRALKISYTLDQFYDKDVSQAILMWASFIYSQKEYGGKDVKNVNFKGFSLSFNPQEKEPWYIVDLINNYRKPSI